MVKIPSRFRTLVVNTALVFLAGLLVADPVKAQTLDEAVTNQLDFGPLLTTPCFGLLDSGTTIPSTVLAEPLLTICSRSAPSPGAGPSTSLGGGSATPVTLPGIVQQRQREAGRDKDDGEGNEPETPGASADAVLELGSRLGLFISGEFESLNRDVTTFENGFRSDFWQVTGGADFRFTDRFAAGLAVTYSHHNGKFVGLGDFQTDSYGILGFASFVPVDGVFIQASGGWVKRDYQRTRFAVLNDTRSTTGAIVPVAAGLVNSTYDGDGFYAGILAGYDYVIKRLTIGPRVSANWYRVNFSGYDEEGLTGLELRFDDDEQTSLQTRVGLQASMAFQTSFGVIVPQAGVYWAHEFKNDQRNISVSFVGGIRPIPKRFTFQNEMPDRDFYEFNAGIALVLDNGVQVFGYYRRLFGHRFFDSQAGTIGLRVAF